MTVFLESSTASSHISRLFAWSNSERRHHPSSLPARQNSQLTKSQISTVPKDVARLVQRVRKADSKVKRQRLPEERQRGQVLSDSELLFFERKGHVLTRALIDSTTVHSLAKEVWCDVRERKLEALRHRVRVLCPDSSPQKLQSEQECLEELQRRGSEPVGFLQTFNIWRRRAIAWEVANQLAEVAATLIGCKSVRLYQDCAFLKEPGYSDTNWHSDLRMAPLDSNDFVTAWIPLRRLKASQDSGLVFASGSHRDFALPFWHSASLESMDLRARGYQISSLGAMELGDVSWHSGWTLHTASEQPQGSPSRLALSISFFKDGTRLLTKEAAKQVQTEDQESFQEWQRELRGGAPAKHKLLPLVGVDSITGL